MQAVASQELGTQFSHAEQAADHDLFGNYSFSHMPRGMLRRCDYCDAALYDGRIPPGQACVSYISSHMCICVHSCRFNQDGVDTGIIYSRDHAILHFSDNCSIFNLEFCAELIVVLP